MKAGSSSAGYSRSQAVDDNQSASTTTYGDESIEMQDMKLPKGYNGDNGGKDYQDLNS